MTYERIKERYLKNYITDVQLERFKALGIITEKQYTELYEMKHPDEFHKIVEEQYPDIKES